MNKKQLRNLLVFVVLMVALKYLFGLRISIIGSLLLTVALSFILSRWD